MEVTFQ